MTFVLIPVRLPGVEFVLLGFDLLLAGMSTVDELPGNLVHDGNPGCLVVHLWLQTLKPGQRRRIHETLTFIFHYYSKIHLKNVIS